MKIAALIAVAALTCGTAFAQSYGSSGSSSRDTSANHSATTANESQPKGEGIMDKTKRAFHRLGEKLHAGKKSSDNTDKTAQQDPESTHAMGASGSGKSDSARQARMDQAYSNSKSKSMNK
jgi:hypothetical protein